MQLGYPYTKKIEICSNVPCNQNVATYLYCLSDTNQDRISCVVRKIDHYRPQQLFITRVDMKHIHLKYLLKYEFMKIK